MWAGGGAARLGLSGVVEADELRALVDGRDLGTGEELLVGSRLRSVRAFDLTLSCPKSVSLLWALGTDEVAEVVAAAHSEAVDVALGLLEERAVVAPQQAGGVRRQVATNGWVVAGFVHRTSREGDPQLHTHCLVPNLVQRRTNGRFVALDAGPVFEWARAAGSVYQNHLQRTLSLRLGVSWGSDHHNTREIAGFSRDQLRAFSKRSVQIEAELEARGERYELPALRMQANDAASLATRTAKDRSLTPTLLAPRWRGEADDVGLATGADLDRSVCWSESPVTAPGWDEITGALVDSETGLCSRSARFTRANVVEQICALSGGRLTAEEVAGAAERFLASELAVRLTPDGESGHRRQEQWSTAAHRALEDRTLALVDALAARRVPAVTAKEVDAALAEAPELGGDQASALRALTGQGGALRSVFAPAGYGKTTMLHTAARAAAADGRPVIAVATTAKAVAELTGAGLDARTIARLRVDLADKPLEAGTVLVLDEISQTRILRRHLGAGVRQERRRQDQLLLARRRHRRRRRHPVAPRPPPDGDHGHGQPTNATYTLPAKLPAGGPTASTPTVQGPQGMAYDAATDNLYVADDVSNEVVAIPGASEATGLVTPRVLMQGGALDAFCERSETGSMARL